MVDVPRGDVRKLSRRGETGARRIALEQNHESRTRIFRTLVHDVDARSRPIGHSGTTGDARARAGARTSATSCKTSTGPKVISGASAIAKAVSVPVVDRDGRGCDRNGAYRQ